MMLISSVSNEVWISSLQRGRLVSLRKNTRRKEPDALSWRYDGSCSKFVTSETIAPNVIQNSGSIIPLNYHFIRIFGWLTRACWNPTGLVFPRGRDQEFYSVWWINISISLSVGVLRGLSVSRWIVVEALDLHPLECEFPYTRPGFEETTVISNFLLPCLKHLVL